MSVVLKIPTCTLLFCATCLKFRISDLFIYWIYSEGIHAVSILFYPVYNFIALCLKLMISDLFIQLPSVDSCCVSYVIYKIRPKEFYVLVPGKMYVIKVSILSVLLASPSIVS